MSVRPSPRSDSRTNLIQPICLYAPHCWKYDTFHLTSVHAIVGKWSNHKSAG
ncbi:hypothetical protein X777_07053 [Ooceraea biroi]|uniref:Uncharacterized protein n=1 Tax=Ooceraea biroi TaxID=2015173 RepID=A0A026W9A2_OOCBI|nr:hypothetical protein X777_07053 [Ooceraea biroi]